MYIVQIKPDIPSTGYIRYSPNSEMATSIFVIIEPTKRISIDTTKLLRVIKFPI